MLRWNSLILFLKFARMLELFNGVKTENAKVLDSVVRFSGEEGI